MEKPFYAELGICRGKLECSAVDAMTSNDRVFKTFLPPRLFPGRTDGRLLPDGVKFIYCVRDPRDSAVQFMKAVAAFEPDCTWSAWLDLTCSGEMYYVGGGNHLEWWEAKQKYPEQILWLVYEDMLRDPEATVRTVAEFLGVHPVESSVVASIAQAIEHSELERRWGRSFASIMPSKEDATPGVYAKHFSQEQLARFRREVLTPAISAGVLFGHEVFSDLTLPTEALLEI